MKHSVEAYNIYDGDGVTLFDGDLVLYQWGGGNDGRPYRTWAFHRLSISRKGKLSISGCANVITGMDLVKTNDKDPLFTAYGLNHHYKVYI